MIQLLFSPVGRWLIGIAVSLLLAGGAYWKGRMDCTAISDSAILRDKLEQLEKQLAVAEKAADAARTREQEVQEQIRLNNGKIEEYEIELSKRPVVSGSCGLSPADVIRLREFARPRFPSTSGSSGDVRAPGAGSGL